MGLDVYLYKVDDLARMKRLEGEADAKEAEIWQRLCPGEYKNLTEEQKSAARCAVEEVKVSLGFLPRRDVQRLGGVWEDDERVYPGEFRIGHLIQREVSQWRKDKAKEAGRDLPDTEDVFKEYDSTKYPDHYFKIGYFRSSYNPSGYDNVAGNHGFPTLSELMGAGEDYHVVPDWEMARVRATQAVAQWEELICGPTGLFSVIEARSFQPATVASEKEALAVFAGQLASLTRKLEADEDRVGYACGAGEFYYPGLTVCGIIPGTVQYGTPRTYLVLRHEESLFVWYRKAAEIVVETCDWVLAQTDRGEFTYCLHWSS